MVYDWLATGKENRIYIHLFKWPIDPLVINGLKGQVAKAYLLADPEKTALKFTQANGVLMVNLPKKTLDQNATVLCLTLK